MLYAIGKALALMTPLAVVATVLLNVLEPGRPVVLGVLFSLVAVGTVITVTIDARRHGYPSKGSRAQS